MQDSKQLKHQNLAKLYPHLGQFGFVCDLLSNVFDKLFFLIQAEDAERREKNLEEAKKIVIEEDKTLPAPKQVLCPDSQGGAEFLGIKENTKFKFKFKNSSKTSILLIGVVSWWK